MNLKKRNLVLQAAVAGAVMVMAGPASAGAIATTFTTYASELFGTGSSATAIKPTPITYQFGVPVAGGSAISVYVALSGGAKYVAGTVVAGNMVCLTAASTTVAASTANISTDSTYAVFSVNPGASGFSTNSTCTFTPSLGSVNSLDTALSAQSGTVNATWTNDSGATTASGVPSGGTNIDTGGTHAGAIATSAVAISGKFVASSAFPSGKSGGVAETKQIDVAATPSTALFTAGANGVATNRVNLGALYFSNTSGVQDNGNGTDYNISVNGAATGLGVVVTGDFSLAQSAAASQGTFIASDLACTAQIVAPAAGAVTYNTGKTTATITGGTLPVADTPMYICMSISATNTTPITPTAYSATATLSKTITTELTTSVASTALLSTSLNGSSVTVHNYVPTTVTGWTTFLRVINTGSVTADIKAALVDETTGVAGTSGLVVSGLKAGGAVTIAPATLEAAIGGAPASTARPRIRITGPTNALAVQTYMFTPNGSFTNVSASQ